jgi:hypothetical protein
LERKGALLPRSISGLALSLHPNAPLPFHCHVPIYEKMGLLGELVCGLR